MRTDAAAGLATLLRPSSVAVIGASEDPFTYSGASVGNLLRSGFRGTIYPVNPRRETVQGLAAYQSVLDVPGEIDTAIVVVPTAAVLDVLGECLEKGIRTVTVVSSGFGEDAAGPEGVVRAEALAALIARTGLRVLGPNTAGLANFLDGYVPRAATNSFDPEHVVAGGIALITQSGALGNTVFNRAQAHGVGVGMLVATGGQIDVDVWELATFALSDERLRTAALVVETVDAAGVEKLASTAASLGKIAVILRLGRSDAGRAAVFTHSGSLAGDDAVQSAALRQLGVIEVSDLDALWQVARLAELWGPAAGPVSSLGVVALSGGEGALIADLCAEYDVPLGPTSDGFAQLIDENFDYATAANPFDPSGEVIGRPEKVKLALRAFIERNEFSDVLIAAPVLRPEIAERQYADLAEIVAEPRPRICLSYWSAGSLTDVQASMLAATSLPVFASSRDAIRALAFYTSVAGRRSEPRESTPAGAGGVAPDARYFDVRDAFAGIGLDFAPAALAHSLEESIAAGRRLGFPVVMKANVESTTHKFANGLLALGLTSEDAIAEAYPRLVAAGKAFDADGVVVEALMRGEFEVMVGGHVDPQFGRVLVFGSGGSMVEFLEDSALSIVRYTTPADSEDLVEATRIGRYLRDQAPAVADRFAEIVLSVAEWFERNSQLSGFDLNPIVVDAQLGRTVCVDARVA